jgi:hypothetical protein
MKNLSENQTAAQLIRYYQQKDKLKNNKDLDFTENGKATTLNFYDEKISELREIMQNQYPERLQEIDNKRANDFAVNERKN